MSAGLPFESLLAQFQQEIWDAAQEDSRIDYDLAGIDTAKKILAAHAALRQKVDAADLCLQAVAEARRVIAAELGGNCAFLDDDLCRWVARATVHLIAQRDAALDALAKRT